MFFEQLGIFPSADFTGHTLELTNPELFHRLTSQKNVLSPLYCFESLSEDLLIDDMNDDDCDYDNPFGGAMEEPLVNLNNQRIQENCIFCFAGYRKLLTFSWILDTKNPEGFLDGICHNKGQ